MGALLQIGGGHWDVTWHALQKPETFFTPPHSIVYLGVLLTLSAGIWGIISRIKRKYETKYVKFLQYLLLGSALQLFSGGFDLWWHTNFGFDGLLSPPHLILVIGMVINAFAPFVGLVRIAKSVALPPTLRTASIISLTALWMSSIGMVMLVTLPFSEGEYFNFNPDPSVGAVTATIAMPLIGSMIIILGHKTLPVRFPVSVLAALYILVNGITTVVAHYGIAPAMPYYVLAILPAVAADFVLRSKLLEKIRIAIASMIFAPFFYVFYFPLVPHAFREVLGIPVDMQITTINLFLATYHSVMVSTMVPAIAMGLIGSFLALVMLDRIRGS
ncbi:MAG: hypothetical protein QXU32_05505 [Nitrososphaerales archaeon]